MAVEKNEYSKLTKHDGRRTQRKGRVTQTKMEQSKEVRSTAPMKNTVAKKTRQTKLSVKAAKDVFGSEEDFWRFCAEQAKEGKFQFFEKLAETMYPKDKNANNTGQRVVPVQINFTSDSKPKEIELDADDAEIIEE